MIKFLRLTYLTWQCKLNKKLGFQMNIVSICFYLLKSKHGSDKRAALAVPFSENFLFQSQEPMILTWCNKSWHITWAFNVAYLKECCLFGFAEALAPKIQLVPKTQSEFFWIRSYQLVESLKAHSCSIAHCFMCWNSQFC